MISKEELIKEIAAFEKACAKKGKPIDSYTLAEAYEGLLDTSYFFKIKASWIKKGQIFKALEFFTDVMFATMSVKARERVFSIKIVE